MYVTTKCCVKNRQNGCGYDIAIFLFSTGQQPAVLDFHIFQFLVASMVVRASVHQTPNSIIIRRTSAGRERPV